MACLGSVVYPHIRQKPGQSARRGTVIHSFIERSRTIGRVQALVEIKDDEIRNLCNAIDLNLFPSYLESEVTYEYNAIENTARAISISKPRDYPYNDGCFYGTADLVGLSEDGQSVIVIDIKTGKRLPKHASENWQLRLLAVAAASTYGCRAAKVALAYINQFGEVEFEWADFDSLDLADYAEELEWLVTAVRKASEAVESGYQIDIEMGDHCEWCPAMLYCPAHMNGIRSMIADLEDTGGVIDKMTPEELGAAYDKYLAANDVVRLVESAFRSLAKNGSVSLGDEYELKMVPHRRRVINPRRLAEMTEWLIKNDRQNTLRPSIESLSATEVEDAVKRGYIQEISNDSMRKVRKSC
jgi:CRISPR/Cas system-associated exonuclease Cas4 (RecB family)